MTFIGLNWLKNIFKELEKELEKATAICTFCCFLIRFRQTKKQRSSASRRRNRLYSTDGTTHHQIDCTLRRTAALHIDVDLFMIARRTHSGVGNVSVSAAAAAAADTKKRRARPPHEIHTMHYSLIYIFAYISTSQINCLVVVFEGGYCCQFVSKNLLFE